MNKVSVSSLGIIICLSVFACNSNIPNNNSNIEQHLKNSSIKTKTSISGKAEFPTIKSFNSQLATHLPFAAKATLAEIASGTTVSLIYAHDHLNASLRNVTIATGLTNTSGQFIINPISSFTPASGDIFILEATKRIGGAGNYPLSVRTHVKWTGNNWKSITFPEILINSKTTALSIIANLNSTAISANGTIQTMQVVSGETQVTDINANVTTNNINSVKALIEQILANNIDPVGGITFSDGQYVLNPILNEFPAPVVFKEMTGGEKIITIAGDGNYGTYGDGGLATYAAISSPTGLFVDNSGNILISHSGEARIRKITKNDIITTIAGTGLPGVSGDGGSATLANLEPHGIHSDNTGNIYIADSRNSRVRKVDDNAIITTIGGFESSQSFSGEGVPATTARLSSPQGVFADGKGNVFIADGYNNRIRKIDSNGIITTVAGGSPSYVINNGDGLQATKAIINHPYGLFIDNDGNMFITEEANNKIRKVDTNGIISTFAGTGLAGFRGDGGPATLAKLNDPHGIYGDNKGNIYVADYLNHRIRKIDKNGIINTVAGSGEYGPGKGAFSGDGSAAYSARLNYPSGVFVEPSSGNLFIIDEQNNRIRKVISSEVINPSPAPTPTPVPPGTLITSTLSGDGTTGYLDGSGTNTKFNYPRGMAIDNNGNIFVADSSNGKVRKITSGGVVSTYISSGLLYPQDIVFDSNNNMYIGDSSLIRKVTSGGVMSIFAGGNSGYVDATGINARFKSSQGLAIDNNGNLFVADTDNSRIRKITPGGVVTTIAGNGTNGFLDSDDPLSAKFNSPQDVVVDENGNIFVADSGNSKIRKIASDGKVTTIVGISGSGYKDGTGDIAKMNYPIRIVLDINGNLFVTEYYNQRIRKITPDVSVTTIAGSGQAGFEDGPGIENSAFKNPVGIAVDSSGKIYIGDMNNQRIRKIDLSN